MKYLIVIFFILSPISLFAQDHYMTLSFGSSSPLGNYADNTDLMDHGFAKTGFLANYSGVYFISENFGLNGNLLFSSNQLDKEAVGDALQKLIPPDFPEDVVTNMEISNTWNHVSILIGPQLTLPLGKFSLDGFATAGLSVIISPVMEITAVVDEEPYLISQSNNKAAFGYNLGASLRYKLNDSYGLILFGSYFNALLNREFESGQREKKESKMNIATSNIGLGIVYRL